MAKIYECMYNVVEELKEEDISIEKLKPAFSNSSSIKNISLLKKAIKELADERINLFIKKFMKKQFDSFIDDTMGIWNSMAFGEIRKLDKTDIYGTAAGMFGYPFNILYFFKQKCPEGSEYTFLDDDANKVYSTCKPA